MMLESEGRFPPSPASAAADDGGWMRCWPLRAWDAPASLARVCCATAGDGSPRGT
ncbi:hypothetical protein B0H12DRAFT_1122600 [Mycena haematopus]|nr:hypothetical protein B0H12DRAFT_1122600 [Mycena haematopus]